MQASLWKIKNSIMLSDKDGSLIPFSHMEGHGCLSVQLANCASDLHDINGGPELTCGVSPSCLDLSFEEKQYQMGRAL